MTNAVNVMATEQEMPWEGRCSDEAYKFALRCAQLRDTNPYILSALELIMINLVTELRDRGFSQSEIKVAFGRALSELPRCAAGEERRGDRA